MAVKVGINGFGRIGRNIFRAALKLGADIDFVAVNDIGDAHTFAHLLKHDTTFGTLPQAVSAKDDTINVDGRSIKFLSIKDPGELPWKDLGVELVVESTGLFTDATKARVHIDRGGAKKVIISAPATHQDYTVVMGVNHKGYDPKKHNVISNASCTTNCFVPLAKVLRDLAGKFVGISFRVPVLDVSVVDLSVELGKSTTVEDINAAFEEAASGELQGILSVSHEELVSSDFKGDPHSSIVDAPLTLMLGPQRAKVVSWYDNEWGFSCRMVDLITYMAASL